MALLTVPNIPDEVPIAPRFHAGPHGQSSEGVTGILANAVKPDRISDLLELCRVIQLCCNGEAWGIPRTCNKAYGAEKDHYLKNIPAW